MTIEQKCKLNETLSEAFELKPNPEEAGKYRWNTEYWRFTTPPTDLTGERQWVPRYDLFTDDNAMLKLIEAMKFRGWYWRGEGTLNLKYRSTFRTATRLRYADAKTLPEATALAACQALGLKVP